VFRIRLSVLGSGSSGNCVFVECGKTKVLFDAGITGRQTARRLEDIGKSIDEIDAIFISHEHRDHVSGAGVLNRRHDIPLYFNEKTFAESSYWIGKVENVNFFNTDKVFKFKDIKIKPFSTLHDSIDPVGFLVSNSVKNLGIVTDIGEPCKNVFDHLKKMNSIVLETNHDPEMLQNGPYPPYLKIRIKSNRGHLSNHDAAELIMQHANHQKLEKIFLAHLSEINNQPDLCVETFKDIIHKNEKLKKVKLILTNRYKPTEVFDV